MKLSSSQKTRGRGRIEIIPLIDIMFFLLATFVMVSTAMIKNRGIAVRLPVAASGGKDRLPLRPDERPPARQPQRAPSLRSHAPVL